MKLARLELIAFGHFAGSVLDLEAPSELGAGVPGVHVVYGDNEAGKSTALRAIRALMYGIPQQTADAFLHAQGDLRIGGEWLSESGQRLYIARRKGRKNTLLDRDGNPLPDELWTEWLSGVDETLFSGMFGLNHETLRHGAQVLLSNEGKAAESLFGASLGTGEVRRLLDELSARADELYTQKGRTKRINQQIAELKRIKAELVSESVSPAAYADKERALRVERAREAEVLSRRTKLRTEQARLERLLRLLPLAAQRAQYQAERAQLGAVLDLPKDSEQRRLARERARDEAGQRLSHEQSEIERVQRRLANLSLDPELLDLDAETLDSLGLALGQHRKAQIDMPKRVQELATLQAEAERLFASLGTDLPFERAQELRLSENEQARLRRLAKEKTQFDTKLSDAAGKLKKAESSLAARRKELQHDRTTDGGQALALAISRSSRCLGLEETLPARRARAAELEQLIANLRARLFGEVSRSSAELALLSAPGRETLLRFEREFEQQARSLAELQQQGRAHARSLLELQAQLRELEGSRELPSPARLRELRAARDRALDSLPASKEPEAALQLVRQQTALADDYADRLFDAAGEVTRRAGLQNQLQLLQDEQVQVEGELAAQRTADQELRERWQSEWSVLGVTPKSPREMGEWLHGFGELRQRVSEREALLAEVHEAERQLSLAFEELSSTLVATGQPPRQLWEQRLGQLLERAGQLERRLRSEAQQHADLVRQFELEEAQVLQLSQELQEQRETERMWRSNWQKALKLVGLERDAGPDEVLSVLDQLSQLFHKLKEIEAMQGRIAGMRRDSEHLGATVQRLLPRSLEQLASQPVEAACEALLREARRARTLAEERERLERELEQRRARAEHAASEQSRAQGELAALMARAGVSDLEALARAEEAAAAARRLGEAIAETESKIVAMGEGNNLAELIEQTRGSEAGAVRTRILELEPELTNCEEQLDTARRAAVRLEQELERWQAGASLKAEELAAATASLQRSVRDYMRLRLAFVLLQQEVERYREQNQGPILSSASELFTRLTLGAYSGLRVGYDAKDQQILLCVGKDGRQVETPRLSDGARDQLYLALRVATLQRYLERHNAVPLVLDDILVHFDDARAAAALQVLGALSQKIQILFFTHHKRMLELARAHLGPEILHVHALGSLQ